MAKRTCSIEGCEKPTWARGWCGKHYLRWWKHGDPHTVLAIRDDAQQRFWSQVDKDGPGGCWLWTGSTNGGYGRFAVSHTRTLKAHRHAYDLVVGPIPDGLQIDHLCHNIDLTCKGGETCLHRRCVNPAHLEAVSSRTNISRAPNHTGNKTQCKHGHPFDEANTYRTRSGKRGCRACAVRSTQRYRAKVASRA